VGIADDRLAGDWTGSYLTADTPAADWASEFADMHHQPSHQQTPVVHPWARDFLGQREHDIW